MQRIYETADRDREASQVLRVEHWEDRDLYEISISFVNGASQMPMRKVGNVFLTAADMEALSFGIQAYLEDRIREKGL